MNLKHTEGYPDLATGIALANTANLQGSAHAGVYPRRRVLPTAPRRMLRIQRDALQLRHGWSGKLPALGKGEKLKQGGAANAGTD